MAAGRPLLAFQRWTGGKGDAVRTLLVTNRPDRPRFETAWVTTMASLPGVTVQEVESGWVLPDLERFEAVVYFVKFRQLREQPGIIWRGFAGRRVLLDHDSFHDYGGWWGSPHIGQWTEVVHRLGFNLMVVSGETSRRHFAAQGITTETLHKGFDPAQFRDLDLPRRGLGHYGSPYGARLAMLRRVQKAGIEVGNMRVPYLELNTELNAFLAILVCNMTSLPRFGRVGRAIQRVAPGTLLKIGPGPEPMAKNFEAAAAGCAVFMDDNPDLEPLGFIDGQTAIVYRDFDELIDKLRYWLDRPDDLRRIGQAAAALSLERHTWTHRAASLQDILRRHAN